MIFYSLRRIFFVLMIGPLMWLGASVAQAEIRVTDGEGHELVLDAPAQRIISLAPNITELLFAVGAGGQVVAVDRFSDYPHEAKALPKIGDAFQLDRETILALKPDLVVAWGSGGSYETITQLKTLGLNVYISESHGLDDIAIEMKRLAELSGTESVASKVIKAYQDQLERLQQRYADKSPVRVFYETWDQPLMTIGGSHVITDMMRLCGGDNVFSNIDVLAPQVSVEAVLSAMPEVIIYGVERDQKHRWGAWPLIPAVKNNHLYRIDADLMVRHTPRILQGLEQLCVRLETAR